MNFVLFTIADERIIHPATVTQHVGFRESIDWLVDTAANYSEQTKVTADVYSTTKQNQKKKATWPFLAQQRQTP